MRFVARYLVSLIFGIAITVMPISAHAKKTPKTDFHQLLKIANSRTSVEQFVAALPTEMRRNFSLIHSTRNTAQHASLKEPRVILSTNSGDLLVAFSGARDQPGSDRVEIIEYDKTTLEYRFHTVDFSSSAVTSEIAKTASPPLIQKNETSCAQCHRGVPIWDTYSDWPGAYGYAHAFQFTRERDIKRPAALEFLEANKNNPRYQALIGLESAVRNSKLSTKNTELSLRLGRQQRDRLLGKLRRLPNYPEIRTALIAGLAEYPAFHELFPLPEDEVKARIKELENDTARRFTEYDQRKTAFALKVEERPLSLHIKIDDLAPSIARFRYVLEHYGIDAGKFSLGFGPESFAMNEGNNGREPLLADLVFDATQGNHASLKFKLSATRSAKYPKVRSLFLLMERPKVWTYLDQTRDQDPAALVRPWSFVDCHDLLMKGRKSE